MDLVTLPAELLFRGAVGARDLAFARGLATAGRAEIPVISVGNIAVGGAGKTPVAAFLAGRLAEWGERPAIVLRGYGADEIAVHEELNPTVPVYAAVRRLEAVRQAQEAGRSVAVVDDGFQHRALRRDLDIVLLSADGWTGAVRLLPRGPWREGLAALRRADLVVITVKAADEPRVRALEQAILPVVDARRIVRMRLAAGALRPVAGGRAARRPLDELRGERVVAVTTLADPRPFAAQLRAAGAEVELREFADHHDFSAEEVRGVVDAASGRPLVMTRKEAVKLRQLLPETAEAWMLEQRVEVEAGAELLDAALRRAVGR